MDLAIPAAVAAVPAVITLLVIFGIHKEWVQILVLLSWLALAIIACLFVGFMPLAILFLARSPLLRHLMPYRVANNIQDG